MKLFYERIKFFKNTITFETFKSETFSFVVLLKSQLFISIEIKFEYAKPRIRGFDFLKKIIIK